MGTEESEGVVHIQKIDSQGHGDRLRTCLDECHLRFFPILIPHLMCIPYFKKMLV